MNRNFCLFKVRGSTLVIPVGFVLKVAREGLVQKYVSKIQSRLDKQLAHIDKAYGGLFYMTKEPKEYKIIK